MEKYIVLFYFFKEYDLYPALFQGEDDRAEG